MVKDTEGAIRIGEDAEGHRHHQLLGGLEGVEVGKGIDGVRRSDDVREGRGSAEQRRGPEGGLVGRRGGNATLKG